MILELRMSHIHTIYFNTTEYEVHCQDRYERRYEKYADETYIQIHDDECKGEDRECAGCGYIGDEHISLDCTGELYNSFVGLKRCICVIMPDGKMCRTSIGSDYFKKWLTQINVDLSHYTQATKVNLCKIEIDYNHELQTEKIEIISEKVYRKCLSCNTDWNLCKENHHIDLCECIDDQCSKIHYIKICTCKDDTCKNVHYNNLCKCTSNNCSELHYADLHECEKFGIKCECNVRRICTDTEIKRNVLTVLNEHESMSYQLWDISRQNMERRYSDDE